MSNQKNRAKGGQRGRNKLTSGEPGVRENRRSRERGHDLPGLAFGARGRGGDGPVQGVGVGRHRRPEAVPGEPTGILLISVTFCFSITRDLPAEAAGRTLRVASSGAP